MQCIIEMSKLKSSRSLAFGFFLGKRKEYIRDLFSAKLQGTTFCGFILVAMEIETYLFLFSLL